MSQDLTELADVCEMSVPDLKGFIANAFHEIEALENASAEEIALVPWAWQLRHDQLNDLDSMTDEQVCQTIVEDLLAVVDLRMKNKHLHSDAAFLVRFLDGPRKERVLNLIHSEDVQHFVVCGPKGEIEIHPDKLQEAMDYSGFYIESWFPETEGTVLRANKNFALD